MNRCIVENITPEQKRSISEENQVRMARSTTALEYILEKLEKGTITFGEFSYLYDNKRKVLSLCEVSELLKPDTIQRSFEARHQEKAAFLNFYRLLQIFWSSCKDAVKGESFSLFILFTLISRQQ